MREERLNSNSGRYSEWVPGLTSSGKALRENNVLWAGGHAVA